MVEPKTEPASCLRGDSVSCTVSCPENRIRNRREQRAVLARCQATRREPSLLDLKSCQETEMLRTLMMSAAVSALMVSGALAQANPPANAPAAKNDASETHSPKFIQAQGTDKLVFSKFKGSDVLGPDNQKVGSITDMLFDKSGKIDGLVVGVGGFLGIGEKNVAIDMSAFQMVPASSNSP